MPLIMIGESPLPLLNYGNRLVGKHSMPTAASMQPNARFRACKPPSHPLRSGLTHGPIVIHRKEHHVGQYRAANEFGACCCWGKPSASVVVVVVVVAAGQRHTTDMEMHNGRSLPLDYSLCACVGKTLTPTRQQRGKRCIPVFAHP
ncbi:hypothetical protein CGRA01v4_00684 [Colletotrichum graminicola]|nr:hypothetical protein CGRA01v4_00684 [Colletotrichum graminicola]